MKLTPPFLFSRPWFTCVAICSATSGLPRRCFGTWTESPSCLRPGRWPLPLCGGWWNSKTSPSRIPTAPTSLCSRCLPERGRGEGTRAPRSRAARPVDPLPLRSGSSLRQNGTGRALRQASDCFLAFLGADVHPTSWPDDGSGGAQWVREEHSGCLAAESVPAHGGKAAAGWEAHLPV